MKKLLLVLIIASSCTGTKINISNPPKDQFNYPYYIESLTPIDQAWTKVADLAAIEGIGGGDLPGKGTISFQLHNPSYTFENDNGRTQDTAAILILPRVRYQELSGERVKVSRIVYPDSLFITVNIRIRPNTRGGSFVNVNIPHIQIKGGHYRNKKAAGFPTSAKDLVFPDTTIVRVPVAVKPEDWASAKSSGVLERYFINLIQKTELGKYNDHPRMPR